MITASPEAIAYMKGHALAWFNEQRMERFYLDPLVRLPRARPMDSHDCLICRSLGGGRTGDLDVHVTDNTHCDVNLWNHSETPEGLLVPDYVFALAVMFDQGQLPDLVDDGPRTAASWRAASQSTAQVVVNRIQAALDADATPEVEQIVVHRTLVEA